MTNPHRLVGHSTDPSPVRPGTSAALTARTIDVTPLTPMALAQRAVSELRVPSSFDAPSPLLLGSIGFTAFLVLLAIQRLHIRTSALLASALLLLPLSSRHQVRIAEEAQAVDDVVAEESESSDSYELQDGNPPVEESVPAPEETPLLSFEIPPSPEEIDSPSDEPTPTPAEVSDPPEMGERAMPPIYMQMSEEEMARLMRRGSDLMAREEVIMTRRLESELRRGLLRMRRHQQLYPR